MEAIFKAHGREFPTRHKAQVYEEAVAAAESLAEDMTIGFPTGMDADELAAAIEEYAEACARVARLFLAANAPVKPRVKATDTATAARPAQEAA
ncbi:hypothetical protein [Desulfarculus baarsii]